MPPARRKPPRSPELGALGEAVKRLREERGLNQEEVGALMGERDHKATGPLERGQREPRYLTLVRLEAALEVPPGTVMALAARLLEEAG